nr:BRO family protein [uncultured Draconibacterium sp.]
MKSEIIKSLSNNFEDHSQTTENGIEFWFARDLQHLLGYTEWRNFNMVITKAKTACEVTDNLIADHFVDVNKTIAMPKGASKEIPDMMLTRYACYLIAQNGDPRKEAIAFEKSVGCAERPCFSRLSSNDYHKGKRFCCRDYSI